MKWGSFGTVHLATLLAMPIIALYLFALYAPQFVHRRKTTWRQTMPPM